MTQLKSFELPIGTQLAYLAEGGANVIYRIVSQADHQILPAEYRGKLLRLRKDTPAGVSYQEIARNFDRVIRPLFNPEELVDQELVYLPKGLSQQCNEQLRAAELTGKRPKQRRGVYLSVTEPFGLLVTDMTSFGNPGTDLAELKPKWLAQSPSAPVGARRCRTCALRDMKNHDARRVGAAEVRSFCPLDLISDKFEHVLRATKFVKGYKDHTRLAKVLYRNPTLLKLLAHQRSMKDVGLYGPSPLSRDKSIAMTLRDCTMYIKMPRSEKGRVEIRLGDLDLKTASGGKAQYWLELEHRLLSEGWYMGAKNHTRSCDCALQSPRAQPPPSICSTVSYSARNGSPKTDILVELAKARRTIYQLGSNSPVPDSEIEKLVHAAILNVPSAFNTQSTRLLVLLHHEHERLWDVAIDVFQDLLNTGAIPKEVWEKQTLPKLQGFRAGVGTILFYEDPTHIKAFSEKFALYRDRFQPWAEHSNAMHQFFLWTGLESLDFAANLQHYNPLIDGPVAKQWNIPSEWKLVAQLVFGNPKGDPGEKNQKPIEDRVKIYGRR